MSTLTYKGSVDKLPEDTSEYKQNDCILYNNDIYVFNNGNFSLSITEEERNKGIFVINNKKYIDMTYNKDEFDDEVSVKPSLSHIINEYQYNNKLTTEKLLEELKTYIEINFDYNLIKKEGI